MLTVLVFMSGPGNLSGQGWFHRFFIRPLLAQRRHLGKRDWIWSLEEISVRAGFIGMRW